MIKEKKALDKAGVILFNIGYLLVAIVSGSVLFNLPFEAHLGLAITSSLAWFVSSFLFARIPNKSEKYRNLHFRWFWMGLIQVILAVLFWTAIKPHTELGLWGRLINMMLGFYGFMTLYMALVSYFFPKILQTVLTPPPNPLDKFPKSTQEIIDRGRNWINGSAGISLFVFFIIGASSYLIRVIKYKDESIDFLLIGVGLGIAVGIILSIIFTYKWQGWARQSGLPEEELKEAAKSAGLWWPNTKNQ